MELRPQSIIFNVLLVSGAICLQLAGQSQSHASAPTVARSTGQDRGSLGRALLAQEPEIKQVGGLMDSWQEQQQKSSYDPSRPSNGQLAFTGYAALRNRMVIIDGLEARLQRETIVCKFCTNKQAELSELLREESAWEAAYGYLKLRTADPIGDLQKEMGDRVRSHYGQPNLPVDREKQRWTTLDTGYAEAADTLRWHCSAQYANNGDQRLLCQANNDFGDRPSDSVFQAARAHEKAWAACFAHNNWVANDRLRLSYETCMAKQDPLSMLCVADRKINPQTAEHECPASFIVRSADISHLLNWTDRYAGHAPAPYVPEDPKTVKVDVIPETRLGVDIKLLDSAVSPSPNQNVAIRGEVARDIAGNALGLGALITVPKGTPAALEMQPYGGGVTVYLRSLNLPDNQSIQFKNQFKTFVSNPPPGYPRIPATGEVIHYAMPSLSRYPMLKTEVERKVKEYSASLGLTGPGADDIRRQRIYSNSSIYAYLMQDIDLESAQRGVMVKAKMQEDITDHESSSHPDGLHVEKGTEI